jgi:RHS repeat-associated protein
VEYHYDVENRLNSVKEQGILLMAVLYDGDGNCIFKVEKKSTSYEEDIAGHNDFTQSEQSSQKSEEWDTYQGVITWDKVIENITKTFVRRDTKTTTTKTTTKLQKGTQSNQAENSEDTNIGSKSYTPTTEIEEEKLYVDPTTNFFWYGFGQGIVQGFSGAPQYLSAWFHDSWDYITNKYYIVRHIKITEYKVKDSDDTTRDLAETKVQDEKGSNKKITDSSQTSVSQGDPSITNGMVVEINKEKQSEEENSLVPDEGQEELTGYEQVLYDTVLIPSGTTEISRDNYVMTSYVNDVNQEYTQVLMEYDVNNEAASVYDYGVQRNSYTNQRSGASQTQYYLYDGQGSVSSLTSVYGNPLVTYQYDAYGVAQVSGETYSPYQYNAEAVDTNTGLQYLRARYYNSSIGSFITQDTYTGTLEDPLTQNLYTYTGNNPINHIDPSGHRYDDSGRNTGKSVENPFSKRDRAPKRSIKTTAGIEDILPTPGGNNLRNLSKPTNQTVKTTAGITDYYFQERLIINHTKKPTKYRIVMDNSGATLHLWQQEY